MITDDPTPGPRGDRPPSDWRDLVTALVLRVQHELHEALRAATGDELDRAAVLDGNPPGWLAWHLTRSYDRNVSEIARVEQRWLHTGWHDQFGRAPDRGDTGYGHTPAQVQEFRSPDADVVLAYHDDVVAMILRWLETCPATDLDRMAPSPTLNTVASVLDRLVGVVNEAFQHLGQINLHGVPLHANRHR